MNQLGGVACWCWAGLFVEQSVRACVRVCCRSVCTRCTDLGLAGLGHALTLMQGAFGPHPPLLLPLLPPPPPSHTQTLRRALVLGLGLPHAPGPSAAAAARRFGRCSRQALRLLQAMQAPASRPAAPGLGLRQMVSLGLVAAASSRSTCLHHRWPAQAAAPWP